MAVRKLDIETYVKKILENDFTYKVEKNEKYGDYRVVEYYQGEWCNEWDNGWTKAQAEHQKERAENGLDIDTEVSE